MATLPLKRTEQPSQNTKYWWLQVLLGIVFILCAFWFLITPIAAYVSFTLVFSCLILSTGVVEVINALSMINTSSKWSLYLTSALIDLFFGAILLWREDLTLEILPVLLGVWLVFRSFQLFFLYGGLKRKSNGSNWWTLVAALLMLLFAIAILANPILGELTLVYTVSFAFFIMGLYKVTLGYRLYKGRNEY